MRRVADACFDRYVRRLVARHFASVHLLKDPSWARMAIRAPSAILVANHSSWWDGFLAWLVSRELGLRFHILMDAANLDRYWMFKWIGALPMHRGDQRDAYRDLTEAGALLASAGNSLWIFPQGARRPPAEAIHDTERGAAHLAIASGVDVIPVAFRYQFLEEQLPEAFIQVGTPVRAEGNDRRAMATVIEEAMRTTLQQLDEQLQQERLEQFRLLLAGRLSVNKRLDRFRGISDPF